MLTSERVFVRRKKGEKSEESLNNISFSSNNSFYEKLDIETKRDIIFLIKSGYDKKAIIKLYIFVKPSNVNEAIHYLTKENGIYQHFFYDSSNKEDCCEICGEKKIMHINEINSSISISFNTININQKDGNLSIIRNKNKYKEKREYKCKICEEDISNEEKIKNKCEQCNNYFCSECLYLHIKELIKNGKYALFCPECKFVYTKDKIDQILLFNIKDKKEINNLKKLLENNNTKEIILSNPELMFCPIANCDGFAKKNNNKEYNICTMGHKFCIKCGELWHNDGKCKEEEKIDKLFQEFSKKYNLKKCPYCHIVTNKNGGCNHMKCHYCGKHWCWLCQEIFISTEEHYGNRNSKCFGKMEENHDVIICSKCENEINDDNFRTFSCEHILCHNCFIGYLLKSCTMIIYPEKIVNCILPKCNGFTVFKGINFIKFIKETNNEELIKKYNISFSFYYFFLCPFFSMNMEIILKYCLLFMK